MFLILFDQCWLTFNDIVEKYVFFTTFLLNIHSSLNLIMAFMSLLFRMFLCLVFYIVIFVRALKNCTGSILKVSIIFLHLLISY